MKDRSCEQKLELSLAKALEVALQCAAEDGSASYAGLSIPQSFPDRKGISEVFSGAVIRRLLGTKDNRLHFFDIGQSLFIKNGFIRLDVKDFADELLSLCFHLYG